MGKSGAKQAPISASYLFWEIREKEERYPSCFLVKYTEKYSKFVSRICT